MAFDKNKPHGLVSGLVTGYPGARYFQDGKYYTPTGKLLGGSEEATVADFAGLHWKQLKKLVEEKGGVYDGREDAVQFLSKA